MNKEDFLIEVLGQLWQLTHSEKIDYRSSSREDFSDAFYAVSQLVDSTLHAVKYMK